MALGFGYNKAKILSAAEKYVQQGKLQNAITEYEKVSKVDPKDLTVLNTIGDLYARLGNGEAAAGYFRKVGERYASDGFAVKAIAMYKKLTKLTPSATDAVLRLAELYTQQGLYNDAKAQYASVADHFLKHNDNDRAAGILHKMLDLDPENAAMQKKVADLYLKLGRKQEAQDIFFNAAQSLHARGSLDAAREALDQILKLDPKFAPALLLRGQMAAEGGDHADAKESLSKLPDLESRPDAQQSLLTAYLQSSNFEEAEPIAAKMAASGDVSGISSLADAMMRAGEFDRALTIYERYADKFLATNSQILIDALTASISRVKDSAPALQILVRLFQKTEAGNVIREVQELLAHACVQAGQLAKSAELYKELSEAEPENPLHLQNYNQIIARMGTDAATRELTVEEGGQALMVDELENSAPAVMQEYTRDIADALNNALTDSELFASYNVPEKAIPPLEAVLPKAPNDVRLRQRLASLYARVNRFADAAQCCTVLADIHAVAGVSDKAMQYREMAAKYTEQAAGAVPIAPHPHEEAVPVRDRAPKPTPMEIPVDEVEAEPIPFQASSVADVMTHDVPAAPQEPTIAEFDLLSSPVQAVADAYSDSPAAEAPSDAAAVDHAADWEEMLSVEAPAEKAEPVAVRPAAEAPVPEIASPEIVSEETADEIAEEARFYISTGMHLEARSAITRIEALDPLHHSLAELRAAISAAAKTPDVVAGPAAQQSAPAAEIEIAPAEIEIAPQSAKTEEFQIAPASAAPVEREIAQPKPAAAAPETPKKQAKPAPVPAESDDSDFLLDLDTPPQKPAAKPPATVIPAAKPAPPAPPPQPAAAAASASLSVSANPLADLVMDIDEALGALNMPSGGPSTAVSAANGSPNVPPKAPIAPHISASSAVPTPSMGVQNQGFDAQSMLSDLLDEFKEEIEEPSGDTEDPETHYNLGVAFREMGLLDEAIGELQKVCRAIDSGKSFSQSIQTYTWLAQCLVDKGAPQAAIRWYQKALHVHGINEDSRLAVHYEMATAFEAAGDRKSALENFMQVYGSNIDYRDVADRIRGLRQ